MVEQGTHKPLVVGSNPSLATFHLKEDKESDLERSTGVLQALAIFFIPPYLAEIAKYLGFCLYMGVLKIENLEEN